MTSVYTRNMNYLHIITLFVNNFKIPNIANTDNSTSRFSPLFIIIFLPIYAAIASRLLRISTRTNAYCSIYEYFFFAGQTNNAVVLPIFSGRSASLLLHSTTADVLEWKRCVARYVLPLPTSSNLQD